MLQDAKKGMTPVVKKGLPDIITFCEDKDYLGLPYLSNPIYLYPAQKIILKTFYRRSKGNEHIFLTDKEIELCKAWGLSNEENGDLLSKYDNDAIFRELVLVWGRRCVGEKTKLVDVETGKINNIGDLWDSGIKHLNTYSLNENNYNLIKTNDSDIFFNGIKDTYRLSLIDGRYLETTDNHPFLTVDGWKNLSEIKKGERIAVPRRIDIFGNKDIITKEEARLVGYMTGDGCSRHGRTCFTNNNEIIIKDFKYCLSTIGNDLELKKDIYTGAESKQYQYVITKLKKSPKKNKLQLLLEQVGLLNCLVYDKFIPDEIYMSSKEVISNYLNALFSCDGGICKIWSKRDEMFKYNISFTSVSEKLAYGIHHLLIRYGIISTIRKRTNIKSNFKSCGWAYEICIKHAESLHIFLKEIGFCGKEVLKNDVINYCTIINNKTFDNNYIRSIPNRVWYYIDEINSQNLQLKDKDLLKYYNNKNVRCHRKYNPSRDKIKYINKIINNKFINNICSDNIIWMPIKKIEFIGSQRTFDISVNQDNCHNFIANEIISHNSGKDFLSSIVATYEAARLLECDGGDPYAIYKVSAANPITILTIATAREQAAIAFKEMRDRILNSNYFIDKLGPESIETERIWLMTPKDKKDNTLFVKKGIPQKKGSIVLEVGHSNSDSLLGKGVFVLILDEVASYKMTGSSASGERIYTAMSPALTTYKRQIPAIDENGNQIIESDGTLKMKVVYDSKIISISSPRGKEGIFWKLFSEASEVPTRLACRLPTWIVNPIDTLESLRTTQASMTEEEFQMEFGAEFSGTAGENFFPKDDVDKCFHKGFRFADVGEAGKIYFAHLDPAHTSHNYALAVVHKENFMNPETGKMDYMIIVDHLKYWHPVPGKPVQVEEVNDYVLSLRQRFHLALVTYDQWNSSESIKLLRKNGMPAKCTVFERKYKMQIYDELFSLVIGHKLQIPYHRLLKDEMLNLQRKYTHNGYKVYPMVEGDIRTDDLVDSLAGACYNTLKAYVNRLPIGKLVNTGLVPSSNNMTWQGMQGPIGYGSGQQIAKRLEERCPWPNSLTKNR